MVDVGVLGNLKVLHDGTRCDDAVLEVLHAESLEVFRAEVAQQLLACRLLGEHPVVELEHAVFGSEVVLEVLFAGAVEEHLLGGEVAKQLLHIVHRPLVGEKLAGGDVEEAHPAGVFAELHGREEVVLLVVEHVVAHGHTRRDQFGDAPLHHLVHFGEPLLALDGGPLLLGVL